MLHRKQIDMVVNIPKNLSSTELSNGYKIRRAAVDGIGALVIAENVFGARHIDVGDHQIVTGERVVYRGALRKDEAIERLHIRGAADGHGGDDDFEVEVCGVGADEDGILARGKAFEVQLAFGHFKFDGSLRIVVEDAVHVVKAEIGIGFGEERGVDAHIVGNAEIEVDDEAARMASAKEIVRRLYQARMDLKRGRASEEVVEKIQLIMSQADITKSARPCIQAARDRAEETGGPAVAIELGDGRIVTGRTTDLLGASSAALLNALKTLADINDSIPLISPSIIEPIQKLKVSTLGNRNPRLHTDEVLIALSISATTNPLSHLAMQQLEKLKHCDVHSSVILSDVDSDTFRRLHMYLTCEDRYQSDDSLYHK